MKKLSEEDEHCSKVEEELIELTGYGTGAAWGIYIMLMLVFLLVGLCFLLKAGADRIDAIWKFLAHG